MSISLMRIVDAPISVYLGYTVGAPVGVLLESAVGIVISVPLGCTVAFPYLSLGYTIDTTVFLKEAK